MKPYIDTRVGDWMVTLNPGDCQGQGSYRIINMMGDAIAFYLGPGDLEQIMEAISICREKESI